MTHRASTRAFTRRARIVLPVALAVATLTLAGPAQAVPDAGTSTSGTATPAGAAASASGCAAEDLARLRANLSRLHGGDYRATVGCDPALGITVQRGAFAGRVTENA